MHSSPVVLGTLVSKEQGPTDYTVIQDDSSVEPGVSPRAGLVDQQNELVEWKKDRAEPAEAVHNWSGQT